MTAHVAPANNPLLTSGTVFIQEGMMLPESVRVEASLYSRGWQMITTDQRIFDANVRAAGWNFFFTVRRLEGTALGALNPMSVRRAMLSILRQVKEKHFNAVQITEIKSHKAFGLIRYVGISAHARHVQKSEQLDNDQQRKTAQEQSAWAVGNSNTT